MRRMQVPNLTFIRKSHQSKIESVLRLNTLRFLCIPVLPPTYPGDNIFFLQQHYPPQCRTDRPTSQLGCGPVGVASHNPELDTSTHPSAKPVPSPVGFLVPRPFFLRSSAVVDAMWLWRTTLTFLPHVMVSISSIEVRSVICALLWEF